MQTGDLAKLLAIPKLPYYVNRVEAAIYGSLAQDGSELGKQALKAAKSGGKRLRPVLAIAAAAGKRKPSGDVIMAAAAVELAHLGSIVHDDIMDKADTRRGAPTVKSERGLNQAILIGDYLLAKASAQAAMVNGEMAYSLSTAITTMCAGQSQELAGTYNLKRSIDDYFEVIRQKTAVLISTTCRLGAVASGKSQTKAEALAKYGEAFGMSYQLLDDLLDFISTPAALNKPVGNDLKGGIYTLPILLSLRGPSKAELREYLTKNSGARSQVNKIFMADGSFAKTLSEVKKYNKMAAAALKNLDSSAVNQGLVKLPEVYLDWALQKISPSYAKLV